MKKLRIGIPAQQVELDPELSYKLATTLNPLVVDLRKAVYYTNPTDAQVQGVIRGKFTRQAEALRSELFNYSAKPVAIQDKLNATLVLHSFNKKALNMCTTALIALRRLELNRDALSTHYIAQQLDLIRDLVDSSDTPTLESALSLVSKALEEFTSLSDLYERLRELANDTSYT